ncbi:MAG TPA: response regulator [Opitutaceae bacterium]|nr:response regulator [Opitutaceae bacterium]
MNFNGTILLVDDEAHIRKFVGLILKQLGAPRLLEAPNGKEAVAIYEKENPDLVLLDINMPIMDGIETLKKLREIDPECIVVMLTSLASRSNIENALALGATNYIRKDTPKEEIAKALSETITSCFAEE